MVQSETQRGAFDPRSVRANLLDLLVRGSNDYMALHGASQVARLCVSLSLKAFAYLIYRRDSS